MRRQNILYLIVLAAVVVGFMSLYDGFFARARCEFGFLAQKSAFLGDKFLGCSNIDQEILGVSGVTDEATDVPGWRIYKPSAPDVPGTIRLRLRKDRDTAFFYPRVSGRDSAVVVAEPTSNIVREWAVVRGDGHGWTPVSRRYVVSLRCIGRGGPETDAPVEIHAILSGPWAQLWHRDGTVFF